MGDSKTKLWAEWAFRILSVLIIPVVVYVFTLHADIAVQGEKIERLEGDVAELNIKVKDIETNKIVLARLETEMKNANVTLGEIKAAILALGD